MNQFSDSGIKVNVIGSRAQARESKKFFWSGFAIMVVMWLTTIILLITDIDSVLDMIGFHILLISIGIAGGVPFMGIGLRRMKNNKSIYPVIGLRDDGVFILYSIKGNKKYITDNIRKVEGKRGWRITGKTRIGDRTMTHKEETYEGDVIFILESESKRVYKIVARNVEYCKETALKISTILTSLKDYYGEEFYARSLAKVASQKQKG